MPYPNEHAARLKEPTEFDSKTFRRTAGGTIYGHIKVPATISIIWGKVKAASAASDEPIPQAVRFPTENWSEKQARKWLKDNSVKFISFEPASGPENVQHSRPGEDDMVCLRSDHVLTATDFGVDRAKGSLRGVSLLSKGPAIGHGFVIDDVMLSQLETQMKGMPNGLPVHLQHPQVAGGASEGIGELVGFATNPRVEAGKVRGEVQFGAYAKSSPQGDLWNYLCDIAEDLAARTVVGLSIRYKADAHQNVTDPRTGLGLMPAGRIKELYAVDFTDDPAANPDGLLHARRTDAAAEDEIFVEEDAPMNEALKKYLVSVGLKADASEQDAATFLAALKDDQKAIAEALAAKAPAAPEKPAVPDTQDLVAKGVQAGLKAERDRSKALRTIAEACGMGADWAQKQFEAGVSVQDAQAAALVELAKARAPLSIRVGDDRNRSTMAAAMTDAILLKADDKVKFFAQDPNTGRTQLGADRKPVTREAHERTGEFRGLRVVEMGRTWLASIGIPDAQSLSQARVAELILSPRLRAQQYGAVALAQGSSDFVYILQDAMGKSLRAAYVQAGKTWDIWARRGSAPDFKNIKRVALSEAPGLTARSEGGQIIYGTMLNSREQYALVEYAAGIKLTRRAIIDDDLDAFSRIPAQQANAAARKEDDVCYAVLTANAAMNDGVTLFYATTHVNYPSSGAVPSVTTLNAMQASMRVQTGPNASILNLMPKYIIHPAALEGTVKQLLWVGQNDTVPSGASAAMSGRNIWAGALTPVCEPRLDATVDSDTDAATWYGACDYNQCDTVEVSFLDDEPEPQLRQETEFDTEDVKFAVRHTVAAKAIDWRGLYKNKGN